MSLLEISPSDALFYDYTPPSDVSGVTFCFFNALTADTGAWEAVIAPKLREQGHGVLVYNMRGQTGSPFDPSTRLTPNLIVDDAVTLFTHVRPVRPVLVGLSIGGLFAGQTLLAGVEACGLVLINTLRKDSARLRWINDALVRAAEVGGLELFRDLFLPLLMNEQWLYANRESFLQPEAAYQPLPKESGHYKLLAEAGREADWDLPYEELRVPVLVVTGLEDHVFLESEAVAELLARLPNARRIDLPNAGHLIPAERPEDIAGMLLDFAKGL